MECVFCKDQVGAELKELPITIDGEVWCPQCFAGKRIGMEPGRFYPESHQAMRCFKCGTISCEFGRGYCVQCGSKAIFWLGPKDLVNKAIEADKKARAKKG